MGNRYEKVFLIFIIIFDLIGFVGCTQNKDDTKSQFIKDFDIDIEEKILNLKKSLMIMEVFHMREWLFIR